MSNGTPDRGEVRMRITSDGIRIIAARATRSFGYGFLAVVLGVYLQLLGYDAVVIGVVFSLMLVGGAAFTILARGLEARLGRRAQLLLFGGFMVAAGGLLWSSTSLPVIVVAAVLGVVSPTGTEVGPFLSLEQAALPQAASAADRNAVFAAFSLAGSLAAAAGALVSGLPSILAGSSAVGPGDIRPLFLLFSVLGVVVLVLYAGLSPAIEAARAPRATSLSPQSRALVSKLAALFALDSFAGGFVLQSFVSFWFFTVWSLPPGQLGVLFAVANVMSAGSFIVAAGLANRIGLIRTMVFTHLPSNLLLMLVPVMPTASSAVAVYLGRMALSQMDVPTRQAYTVGVVAPEERVAAAGYTNVARNVSQSLSPPLGGAAFQVLSAASPFLIGGGLKIAYDLAMFREFRKVAPRTEESASAQLSRSGGGPD